MVEVNANLDIPEKELKFAFARSGGPGGQNVNKVNTKATLFFDVDASPSLSDVQKEKIKRRLPGRISKEGILKVTSVRYRSQKANREDAVKRFALLISFALHEKTVRKKTKVSRGAKERRFQAKKRRGNVKQLRKKIHT